MQSTKKIQIIMVVIGALLMATAAGARQLSMTGEWFQNRGPLIDIPAKGGAVFCAAYGGSGTGLLDGCLNNLRPALGGIPGSGNVNVSGSSPAAFTIEPSAFSLFPGTPWVVAVAVAPTVQQLASTFTFMGPGHPGFDGNPGPAQFIQNAPTAQPARLAADFSWCPGGGATGSGFGPGVTGCTDPANATPTAAGNWNGRVRYVTGANKFGGTMSMIMGGVGYVSVVVTAIPTFPLAIGHQLVGGGAGKKAQMPGQTYGAMNFNNFPAGNLYATFMTNFSCTNPLPALPFGCGVITAQGFNLGPFIPADSQVNFGMPWTTGQIIVSNTGTNKGKPATTVLDTTGYDNRTALGAGKITLIAGGTTHRHAKASGPNPQNYGQIDILNLEIGSSPVPAMSPMGLVSAAVLMMLAVGYAFRRRLVTNV